MLPRRLASRTDSVARRKCSFNSIDLPASLEQTHNVAMALPTAGYVVTLSSDGRIASHGPAEEVLKQDAELQKEVKESEIADEKADDIVDAKPEEQAKKKGDGKLIVAEEIAVGHVGWPASK